jgi:hypothetical protein
MNPATEHLLRAVAAVASYAQAHPTDGPKIRLLKVAQGKAEATWIASGSPDLPDGPRPAIIPAARRTGVAVADEDKDWTRVRVLAEVKRMSERAYLLDQGDGAFWCPKALLFESDVDFPEVGDVVTAEIPRWVLP